MCGWRGVELLRSRRGGIVLWPGASGGAEESINTTPSIHCWLNALMESRTLGDAFPWLIERKSNRSWRSVVASVK